MQTTRQYKQYVGEIAAQTHQAIQRMQSPLARASWRDLPFTPVQVMDYVDDLLEGVQPVPGSFLESAIGQDIEHLKAVEDFLSVDDGGAGVFLTPEEQRACDVATD